MEVVKVVKVVKEQQQEVEENEEGMSVEYNNKVEESREKYFIYSIPFNTFHLEGWTVG